VISTPSVTAGGVSVGCADGGSRAMPDMVSKFDKAGSSRLRPVTELAQVPVIGGVLGEERFGEGLGGRCHALRLLLALKSMPVKLLPATDSTSCASDVAAGCA